MKIAIIGPSFPYRGGIAHHNNLLYKYLSINNNVDLITFKRQYPQLLFPGASQVENILDANILNIAPERIIDSLNPLNWIAVGKILKKRCYDLLIFRFWLPQFGPCFGTIARLSHRQGKKDVLVIVDNLIPHERRLGDKALTRMFFRHCTMAITQSSYVSDQFGRMFPKIPQVMLPHPVYEYFGNSLDKIAARRRLGLPEYKKIIMFFGFIRRYKGLDVLLKAMPEVICRIPDVHLIVVGEFIESYKIYLNLINRYNLNNNITLYKEYVPTKMVAEWFSAADLLVLPYRSATNSGIVQIAYNFALPAIVTNVGNLAEVIIDGKTGLVLNDITPESLADSIKNALKDDVLKRFSNEIIHDRKNYKWETFIQGVERFVREIQGSQFKNISISGSNFYSWPAPGW